MELSKELSDAVEVLRRAQLDGHDGLTQELFLLVSALVPIPNVDLLVVNQQNQLLLSRRNDEYFQKSWHIPGGCMRYGESLEQRIQATAQRELGSQVRFDSEPIAVRNVLRGENTSQRYPKERGHNIAILYQCWLPEDFHIDNGSKTEDQDGYLRWFDHLPEDFMQIQCVYKDILEPWKKGDMT